MMDVPVCSWFQRSETQQNLFGFGMLKHTMDREHGLLCSRRVAQQVDGLSQEQLKPLAEHEGFKLDPSMYSKSISH